MGYLQLLSKCTDMSKCHLFVPLCTSMHRIDHNKNEIKPLNLEMSLCFCHSVSAIVK